MERKTHCIQTPLNQIEMSNDLVTSIVKGTDINTANDVQLISNIIKNLLEIDVVKSEVCDCFIFT